MDESRLKEQLLLALQAYEDHWQQKLQEAELRIQFLEQENAELREELEEATCSPYGVEDEILADRLRRLGTPPLDTLIREAGVVLEDRLRQAAGEKGLSLHGVALVDAVLAPDKGYLVLSSHSGEQEGVRMLYRGAMQFIRNPPMHKLIEYPENMARLFLRLIDALLQVLKESIPKNGEATVSDIRRMLTRRRVAGGQKDLYRVLSAAGDHGMAASDLAEAMERTRDQLAGVLGALGRRINNTEGLEGLGGICVVLDIWEGTNGEWHYRMKPILRQALEAENLL